LSSCQLPDKENNIFSDLSTITKGAGITFAGIVIGKAFLFLYTIFLTRFITANDFGIYTLGITLIMYLASLADLGLGVTSTRFIAIYQTHGDHGRVKGLVITASAITLIVSLMVMVVVILFSDIAASAIFHKPQLGQLLKVLSISLPFECVMRTFLRTTQGLKLMSYSAIVEQTLWIVLRLLWSLIIFFWVGMNLEVAAWSYTASSAVCCLVAFYFLNKHILLFDRTVVSIYEVRSQLKFSIPMVVSIFLGNISRQLDVLMLGLLSSANELGIYASAMRLAILAEFIYQVFNPIFNPMVSELCEKMEIQKLGSLLKIITRWNFIISLPIFLCLAISPKLFLIVFGERFIGASMVLTILAVARIFSALSSLPNTMIYMSGRSDITVRNNVITLLVNLCLNYYFIHVYGIIGAAMSTGISLLILSAIRIIEVYNLMKVHPFSASLFKPIIAAVFSLIGFAVFNFQFASGMSSSAISVILFLIIYIVCIILFQIDDEEIQMMALVKNKLSSFREMCSIKN